ncbi:MAG: conserved phage C-terminal domain-containing protein [Nitrospira sp.]|nr:conserved phage C-terminal domain-containing protein [Nitrospira sp.]
MPNRWIRESARTSKNLNEVSDFAERLFWRLITTADDYGRFLACGSIVRSACFPLMDTIRVEKVEKAIAELKAHKLIDLYEVGDRRYGCFLKWFEHQGKPRSEKSKYPDPLPASPSVSPLHTAANNCAQPRTDAPGPPDTETDSETDSKTSPIPRSFSSLPPESGKSSEHAEERTAPAETALPTLWEQAESLLAFLNRKAAKNYLPRKPNKDPTVSLKAVHALLKQGYTEEQVRKVIANRLLKWGDDPKMREYLRPDTLFRPSKFEQYLGELGVTHAMPHL